MELTDALFDLCKTTPQPIIAIDGPAGAGKTTLAEHLSAALSLRYKSSTLHMDDLYHGWDSPFDTHFTDALLAACSTHKENGAIKIAKYDWARSKYGEVEKYPPAQLLILEGVGSSCRAIRPFLTATIWIEVDPQIGLERVLARDGDYISQEMKLWQGKEVQHFAENESQKAADFVLTT